MKSRIMHLLKDAGVRFDANETAFLDRELTDIEATTYDVQYSKLKAKEFVPMVFDLPEWATTWESVIYDHSGRAELIASYSDDLPRVDSQVSSDEHKVLEYGVAFGYNVSELRANARARRPIDGERARIAREACDRFLDEVAAFGSSKKNIKGFLNNGSVPNGSVGNGDWLNASTTTAEVLEDLFEIEQTVISQSDENHMPTDMLLPPDYYGFITTTPRSSNSDLTIAQYFLQHAESVKNLSRWKKLNTADSGTDPLVVCYEKSPMNVKMRIAIEFEMMEAEKRNLEYIINCLAKCAGCVWTRPLAGFYATGIGAA